MRFVYPEFLWALSLLIVPVIIHLFSFRRYKTLYFSSLQFIQHVERQNKSTQKLKNLLILMLDMIGDIQNQLKTRIISSRKFSTD